MSYVMIGAGGHAGVVLEIAKLNGLEFVGFVDPKVENFGLLAKLTDGSFTQCIMGIGGVKPDQLKQRYNLYLRYKNEGASFRNIVSPLAIVSENADLEGGIFINHGAIVQTKAKLGDGVIINSGAIIEHDVVIGEGSHIAPGAIVLGGAQIGRFCMVGAGAVILPGTVIENEQ
jgi:sugar O-acyltransferase (sialic acid O-acetyltransferase NeuD family)